MRRTSTIETSIEKEKRSSLREIVPEEKSLGRQKVDAWAKRQNETDSSTRATESPQKASVSQHTPAKVGGGGVKGSDKKSGKKVIDPSAETTVIKPHIPVFSLKTGRFEFSFQLHLLLIQEPN